MTRGAVWAVAGLTATVGFAACSDAESGAGQPGAFAGAFATPVEVAAAWEDTVVDAIFATGEIEPLQSIELRPEVEGRLVEILVPEGAEVNQGTPLFKVDDGELRAQVARLEAERDLASQALKRTRELVEKNGISTADLERAEANARSAEAELELLQLRLDRTLVRAPFGGVVGQRFVSLGDYVTTSTRLVTLQTVNPQRAVFLVPERYAQRLEPAQRITFHVAAVPEKEFRGVVDFVDPVVQLPARTITVKARVPNRGRELKAGMFIEVRLATAVRPDAIVIPEDAILPLQGANYVWVVNDERASRRQVELGVRMPGLVEVTSGLAPGEHVVIGGLERMSEGASVVADLVDRRPK